MKETHLVSVDHSCSCLPRKDTQCMLINKLRDYMRTFEHQNTLNVDDRPLRVVGLLHRSPLSRSLQVNSSQCTEALGRDIVDRCRACSI